MSRDDSDPQDQWYVLHDQTRLGPYSFEQLVEAANSKTIKEAHLIRCQGRGGWIPARAVPGLFSPLETGDSVHQFLETMFPASPSRAAPGEVVAEPDESEYAQRFAGHRSVGTLVWAAVATVVVVTIGVLIRSTEFSSALVPTIAEYATDAFDSLTGGGSENKVDRTLNSIPAYAILRQIDPPAHDRIRRELSGRYAVGASKDQILSGARNVFFKALQPYLMRATDAAVLENIDIVISYMEGLKDTDAESCVSLVDEPKRAKLTANLTKQFPAIFQREMALHAEVLNSVGGQDRTSIVTTEQQAGPYLVKVFNTIASRPGLKLDLMTRDKLAPSEFRDYCQVTLALFREVRQLPKHEAVQVLRYLYSLGNR